MSSEDDPESNNMPDESLPESSLPADLKEQILAIYDVLGSFFGMTLAEFEAGFLQEDDPEHDVGLWLSITAVWIDYHEAYLDDVLMSDADEKKLLSALIAISAGVEDPDKLGVPEKIGKRLLECYAKFEDELDHATEEDV